MKLTDRAILGMVSKSPGRDESEPIGASKIYVAADGKIYLFSESGEALVLRAGRKPEVLARNKLNEHFIASPAIADGKLFVRSDLNLIAIGKRKE